MNAVREMNLKEYMEQLSDTHAANREYQMLKNDLSLAIKYLKEGKAKFAPNTTNSFVDDLIKKYTHDVHTTPVLGNHIESADCYCSPELAGDYSSEGGVKHYVHKEIN